MKWKFFMVGARVEYVGGQEAEWIRYRETGTIVGIYFTDDIMGDPNKWDIAVDWDKEDARRHNCAGNARNNHGWCVSERDIEITL